jgi:hypothetical protein
VFRSFTDILLAQRFAEALARKAGDDLPVKSWAEYGRDRVRRRPSSCYRCSGAPRPRSSTHPDHYVMTFDALVLNARLRQSLVTVRSLRRRGLKVAAVDTVHNAPAFSSRWCSRALVFAVEDGTDAYLRPLKQTLAETGARVLIPSHDGTIALLRRHREPLERIVQLALADELAMSIAVSKERTLEVTRGVGLVKAESHRQSDAPREAAGRERSHTPRHRLPG